MDPEMGYKVRHLIRPGLISMRPNPIDLLVLRKTILNVCLIINFLCNLHIFKILASKFHPTLKNMFNCGFLWKLDIEMYISNGQKNTCPSLQVAS